MTTSDYLTQLQTDKNNLVTNLETMGITGLTGNETFTELVPEVLNIQTGGNNNAFIDGVAGNNNNGIRTMIISVDNLNLGNITDINNLFSYCRNLISVSLFDTSNVTNFSFVFSECAKLTTIPLFNTSNATTMRQMFLNCNSLISIPLINTSNVTDMFGMFNGDTNLQTVPLLNTDKVTNMSDMFRACSSLSTQSLDNILQMCIGATSYGGTKTLYQLGFRSNQYSAVTIQALAHYQDFIDAGWTIGY